MTALGDGARIRSSNPSRRRRETEDEKFNRRTLEPQRVASASGGMVSTAHPGATAAGVAALEAGGNAVDAAVWAALALGVCEPAASGLGGQTMMLVHLADESRTFALDGSSRAPSLATIDAFDNFPRERRRGHRATTVASSPAVYDYALERYGRLGVSEALQPAIRLAEEGYKVSELQGQLNRRERKHLLKSSGAASLFLRQGRLAYREGDTFCQPVLAATLRRLADVGFEDFYLGKIAQLIVEDMEQNGGFVRADDLALIPQPIEREPLKGRFYGNQVRTMPPPSAGRTLIEMMNIYKALPAEFRNLDTPGGAVLFAKAVQQAFWDRQDRPFDPAFYPQVDQEKMLSPSYGRALAARMLQEYLGNGETTHLSVMDADGNAVALTQSIENVYGACAASPQLGFLYNNYLSAFDHHDPSNPFYLRPNAVPWASVAPTLVFQEGQCRLAIGSPGSERIAPSVLQVMIRLRKLSPLAAVEAPRLHCSIDGVVSLEAPRMSSEIQAALAREGFEMDQREAYSFYMGCVQMVMRRNGSFVGVADPRRDGSAAGPSW